MRAILTGIVLVALGAGAAYAADSTTKPAAQPAGAAITTSKSNIKSPPPAMFTADDCKMSGGTVSIVSGAPTCVYTDGRKGRGIAVARGGGSF